MAIKFDYNRTLAQAEQLDELSFELQSMCAKSLDGITENLHASWTGETAGVFSEFIASILKDVQSKAAYLSDTANFLRRVAIKLREADEAASKT